MPTTPTDPSPSFDPTRSKRRVLLLSACSLLALGIGLNAHRHLAPPTELSMDELESEDRFVAAMMQPEEPLDEEAGGQGQRHKGEEGKMGKPTSRQKSGLYAMKGPAHAVPQMARHFDLDMAGRNAGIMGMMAQESGHFLASPYGAAFAVGNDDDSVWGGPTGGVHGAGGLGLIGKAGTATTIEAEPAFDPEVYRTWVDQAFVVVADDPVSTFSVDVDTGSYSLVRQSLNDFGRFPSPDQVRIEELVNYFDYDYPEPSGDVPVSITTEVGPCPWDADHRLVHVGLQGRHVAADAVPPRNLVFLIDVSGSMSGQLPLVINSLTYLTEQLGEQDFISIVVYAGAAGVVLPPTPGSDKATILGALERLQTGGSTNGSGGIHLAYAQAQQHFIAGGINRVVLATDGDFNVGTTNHDELMELIETKRHSGVFLSVLGYGMGNYQDHMMEQLADKGNGNYAYIDGLAEARKVLVEQAGATLVTIAKDVKLQVDFDRRAVKSYRLVGYENRVLADRDFADDTKDAGEIGSGHTVTALYEIVPTAAPAEPDWNVMELKLRYKEPDGDRSRLVQVPVPARGAKELSQTSNDFRFSAAVAGFGQSLWGFPTKVAWGAEDDPKGGPAGVNEVESLKELRDLALHARGEDRQCRRAELVGLIERASALEGHPLEAASIECRPTDGPRPVRYDQPLQISDGSSDPASGPTTEPAKDGQAEPFDWARFVLEVLYLLPPLLALPLFVMALRRPRRRWEE
ncbi:vWA domain-containing protein [Paraliomyxa miuraensis]|uniref:vWA domain-containing protein n=1 Tax=Paraliomyxa miuraensis TaxID=376150 RepID=UPI002254471B|nr:VWA domain-containing protein [Paraliomyxa miuraensis]MCX4247302.1 VWA domain-containing protein [Paraliomyxa miuraensis]